MDFEFLTIRHDRLLAASALVPIDQRAIFFSTLLVGPNALAEFETKADDLTDDTDSPISFALSVEQARELKGKVDRDTWAVVKAIVTEPQDDVGTIDWSEVKLLTGVTNWAQFAKGRMGGLHRSLHKIAGVPKNAVLLWEGEGWVEDGKGDYLSGTIGIDGPAVRTLRIVCGI